MKKSAMLALAVVLAAGLSTTADAAKKKRAPAAKPAAAMTNPNQNSINLVGAGLSQVIVPFQSMSRPQAAPAKAMPAKKKTAKKAKRSKKRA